MLGGMLRSVFEEFFTITLDKNLCFKYTDISGNEWNEEEFNTYTQLVFGGNNSLMIRDITRIEYAHIFDKFDEFFSQYRVILDGYHGEWMVEHNKRNISYDAFSKSFVDKFSYIEQEQELHIGVLSTYLDNWFIENCEIASNKLLTKGVWGPTTMRKNEKLNT